MRVAVYARYSSDLQDPRSIADQIALCHERARREGWRAVAEFSDAAISGASMANRPGLADLMRAAEEGRFDALLTESLDRLSRDMGDLADIHKRLKFWGVEIITLADGPVSKLHVGLRGIIGSVFLDDLRDKTRRGLIGRLKNGRSTGGRTYGYRPDAGEPGLLKIVPEEASVVRRVFAEYTAGRSPLAIVTDLNRERIPSPRGGHWSASTINGSRKRANGIIGNRLYIGEAIYGRQKNVKDPVTGRSQKRLCPESEWIVQPVPDLAIIEPEIFAAAQERRKATCQVRLTHRRRPRRVLSGLIVCGTCGGTMAITRDDRLQCSTRINKGTCDNRRMIRAIEVEERVLATLQEYLLQPEVVGGAIEAYRVERARLAAVRAKAERRNARDLAEIDRKISRIIDIIESKDHSREEASVLAGRIAELERERMALLARAPAPVEDATLALHPTAAARYRRKVAEIHAALSKGDAAATEAIAIVRELITRVVVTPTPSAQMPLTIEGNLAAMLDRERTEKTGAVLVVPPPRIERGTSRSTI